MEETPESDILEVIIPLLRSKGVRILELSGIILNLCSIYILRKGQKGPTTPAIHYYLTAVLLWQTGALLCLLFQGLPLIIAGRMFTVHLCLELALQFGYSVSLAARLWLVVAMTVDRFLALCYPFKHATMATTSRAKRTIITITGAALLFSIPDLFYYTLGEMCITDQLNKTHCEHYLMPRERAAKEYFIWYSVYDTFDTIFCFVGPRAVVVILAIQMVRLLTRQFEERRRLLNNSSGSEGQSKNKELELDSLILIVKSGLGSLLLASLYLLSILLTTYVPVTRNSHHLFVIVIVAEIVNMSSNFFVFLIFGRTFRETCQEVLLNCWK